MIHKLLDEVVEVTDTSGYMFLVDVEDETLKGLLGPSFMFSPHHLLILRV